MKAQLRSMLLAVAAASLCASIAAAQPRVTETDLVSDIAGRARFTDPNLVNPWGMSISPTGNIWVSDNEPGLSTIYGPDGTIRPLVVTIPGGKPTGQVFNATDSAFTITNGDTTAKSLFIFATENGTISAWSPGVNATNAVLVVTTPDAIYKGLALAHTSTGPRLYAADFHGGKIDVFDAHFAPLTLGVGAFTDGGLPAGYGPFNVQSIHDTLYVTYALRDSAGEDEVAGSGLGAVDVYDADGHMIRRFATGGPLNAPWGVTLAPPGWAGLSNALLVGNFGNGAINAFDAASGNFIDALHDSLGNTLAIDGLWAIDFFRPVLVDPNPGQPPRLFFTAGLDDEAHGLFGSLAQAGTPPPPPPPPPVACNNDPVGLGFWKHLCATPHGHGHGGDSSHRPGGPPGGPPGEPSDSLQATFACISAGTQVFGANGCFTAGCDLLNRHGPMTAKERAARQFLVLLLNRCAGRICDSLHVTCAFTGTDSVRTDNLHTVGDIIAFIDARLCQDGTPQSFAQLGSLAACTMGGEGEDEDGDDDGGRLSGGDAAIRVLPLLPNPVRIAQNAGMRFRISTAVPTVVRLGIYDAAGRLVAEPLRDGAVNGTLDLQWNGMNLRGTTLPSGTYFYRAMGGGSVASGRIVIVR